MAAAQKQLRTILLALLPEDYSAVGNITLLEQFVAAARDAGLKGITEEDFKATRDALVEAGEAVKGKGRGGSTARVTGANRPDFALQSEVVTPDMLLAKPAARLPSCARDSWRNANRPRLPSTSSFSVKPSFNARVSSCLKAASTFARFCGAKIALACQTEFG